MAPQLWSRRLRRRRRLPLARAALLLALAGCSAPAAVPESSPAPDLVLIQVEALPWAFEPAATSALAGLADQAARFDVTLASSAARDGETAALFTALSQLARGADHAFTGLRRDRRTLAESLAARGYRTVARVTGRLAAEERPPGLDQGFAAWLEGSPEAGSAAEGLFSQEVAREPQRPLFLFLHLTSPAPLEGILTDLAASGRGRRAAIVVTSTPAAADPAAPLGPAAGRLFLLLRTPSRLGAGERFTVPGQSLDLAPTLLDLAGAEPLPAVGGRSLLPVLRGRPSRVERVAVITATRAGETVLAVHGPDWKALGPLAGDGVRHLFDLSSDPGEGRDLSASHPALRERAAAHLRGARQSLAEARRRHRREPVRSPPAPGTTALWADPNPIMGCWGAPTTGATTTVHWNAGAGVKTVQVRIGGPRGSVMATGHASGSQTTGSWVHDGLVLSLVEVASGRELDRTVLDIRQVPCAQD